MKLLDLILTIDRDEWYLAAVRDELRQYKHESKTGRITLPGNSGDEVSGGAVASVLQAAQLDRS